MELTQSTALAATDRTKVRAFSGYFWNSVQFSSSLSEGELSDHATQRTAESTGKRAADAAARQPFVEITKFRRNLSDVTHGKAWAPQCLEGRAKIAGAVEESV